MIIVTFCFCAAFAGAEVLLVAYLIIAFIEHIISVISNRRK